MVREGDHSPIEAQEKGRKVKVVRRLDRKKV
jgi:hypothetical protein